MVPRPANSLSALLQHSTIDDHEELLKAANEALKKSKADLDAQQIRAIALLKLDRYDDALRAFEEGGADLRERYPLAFAYALYKTGKLEEAREVARVGHGATGLQHVDAQAAYRLEDFPRAAELYSQLSSLQHPVESEASDLRINSGATDAQLCWAGQGHLARRTKADRDDLEQFETAFNVACGYVTRRDMKQAEVLLRRARDLCNASELSDAEKKAELLPIFVQHAYVLHALGKSEEAAKLCKEVEVTDNTDQTTRYIAQSNLLACSLQSANPYLAQRQLQSATPISNKDALFKFQDSALHRNRLALDLSIGKASGVGVSTRATLMTQPKASISHEVTSAGAYNAAAHTRGRTGKMALKAILPLLERRPNDVGLLMTIVQIYLVTNNFATATLLLEAFFARLETSAASTDLDTRYAPGLVAIFVALDTRLNRTAHIKSELARAAAHWRRSSQSLPTASTLFKAAGAALLDAPTDNDLRQAQELFKIVHEQDPFDRVSAAGLAASAANDTPGSKAALGKLPPISKLIAGIDAAALEEAGVAVRRGVPMSPHESKKRSAPEAEGRNERPRPAKKSQLPKDYDPSKQPDAERWLPLRDRSNWRPKGRKKGKLPGGMATQGGFVSEDSRPATPSLQVLQSKAKKKKGKGGK